MTSPEPAVPPTAHGAVPPNRAVRAGVVAAIAYGLIGWRSLLVPSLIRSIEPAYGQTDAGMGTYFLATALGYATGSLAGGKLVRGLGSRVTLAAAALLVGIALMIQGLAPPWSVFLPVGAFAGVAASVADVATNTLFLDLFPRARGRALNLLHLSWSIAALVAPLVVALAVEAGAAWSSVLFASGAAWLVASVALGIAIPRDARDHAHGGAQLHAGPSSSPSPGGAVPDRTRPRLPPVLLVMGLAIGCYVAAESAVSDWLVRVLADLPLPVASLALTLFWGGMTIGRGVFARVGNRVDPMRAASLLAAAAGVLLAAALTAPVAGLSLALFGAVGVACGPVFPLIFAVGGTRMPGRTATVSTVLTFCAVMGAVVFPPVVGFLSDGVGLHAAMLGAAALCLASAAALQVVRRMPVPAP